MDGYISYRCPFSVEQYSAFEQTREAEERSIFEKAVKEKEMIEAEKRKAQKEREETMRNLMGEFQLHDAAVKAKRKQEKKDWKAWEMMQRFKRSEYDERVNFDERKQELQQKREYRNELRRDIVSKCLYDNVEI